MSPGAFRPLHVRENTDFVLMDGLDPKAILGTKITYHCTSFVAPKNVRKEQVKLFLRTLGTRHIKKSLYFL